jgi:predicted outer membrane protein
MHHLLLRFLPTDAATIPISFRWVSAVFMETFIKPVGTWTRRIEMHRRSVLLGIGAVAATTTVARAQTQKNTSPAGDASKPKAKPKNEKEFRMGVIGPAELSLVTSQIAVERATQADAKEFAGFELEEAKAVTAVLKDLETPVPEMDAKSKATLEKIKAAPKGAAFDRAYIAAQLENHEHLRDWAEAYLSNSAPPKSDMAEGQGRHLATLALATFKEHVAITKRITKELKA